MRALLEGMRAWLLPLVVVSFVTPARAHGRLDLELLGVRDLHAPLIFGGEPWLTLGVANGEDGKRGTLSWTLAKPLDRDGDFAVLRSLAEARLDLDAPEPWGSHRAALRFAGARIDASLRHAASARTMPLRLDVVPAAKRDSEVRAGVEAVSRDLKDARFVVPIEVAARRVEYSHASRARGFSRLEIATAGGIRFEKPDVTGTAEVARLAFASTRFDPRPGDPGPIVVDQFDARMLNYKDILFSDGKSLLGSLKFSLGYSYLRERATEAADHVPVFELGGSFEDRHNGFGLVYAIGPIVTPVGEVGTGWRVELSGHGRRRGVGGWHARFAFACVGDTSDGPCDDDHATRAGAELEAFAELSSHARIGASWIAEHGPWPEGAVWRSEVGAFLRITP